MKPEGVRSLLERIGVLQHPCDLDLVLFFARHPRSLIASEQLAAWLGYELKQIAASLDVLLNAQVLTRTQNPILAARMYVFDTAGPSGGWLPRLLSLAVTREGRLAMIDELTRSGQRSGDGPVSHHNRDARAAGPRRVVARHAPGGHPDSQAG